MTVLPVAPHRWKPLTLGGLRPVESLRYMPRWEQVLAQQRAEELVDSNILASNVTRLRPERHTLVLLSIVSVDSRAARSLGS